MNENISKIHLDILDHKRQEILAKLQPVTKDFVLGGGTAMALQIQHRQSFDFDFFCSKPIPKNLLEQISQYGFDSIKPVFDTKDELTVMIDNEIKVTFLFYPFPKVFDLVFSDDGMSIFSLEGIAAQKAYTVGRRGVWRDYYDIFSLIYHDFISLAKIIELAQDNYGDVFNTKLFLSQLTYFDDIQDFSIEKIENGELPVVSSDKVKLFLAEEVKKYMADF